MLDNHRPFFTLQTKRGLHSWGIPFRTRTPGHLSSFDKTTGENFQAYFKRAFRGSVYDGFSRNPLMFLSWGKSPVVFLFGLSGAPRQNPQGVFHTAIPPSYITVGSTNGRFSNVMEWWKEMVVSHDRNSRNDRLQKWRETLPNMTWMEFFMLIQLIQYDKHDEPEMT